MFILVEHAWNVKSSSVVSNFPCSWWCVCVCVDVIAFALVSQCTNQQSIWWVGPIHKQIQNKNWQTIWSKSQQKKFLKFHNIFVHTNMLRIGQSKKWSWFSFQWLICTINCALYFILFGKRTKKTNINQKFKWKIDSKRDRERGGEGWRATERTKKGFNFCAEERSSNAKNANEWFDSCNRVLRGIRSYSDGTRTTKNAILSKQHQLHCVTSDFGSNSHEPNEYFIVHAMLE